MAGQRHNEDQVRLVRALADLFDRLGPASRMEAEEELRSAGTDPNQVGMRIEQLADEMLDARPGAVGERLRGVRSERAAVDERAPRRRRLPWAAAAGLAGGALAWALLRPPAYTPLLPGSSPQGSAEAGPERSHLFARRPPVPSNADSPQDQVGTEKRDQASQPPDQSAQESAVPSAENHSGVEAAGSDTGEARIPQPMVGVAAGMVVTAENGASHASLLSPGVQWAVRNGLQMRVVDPRAVRLPKAYRDATTRYSPTVSLAPDKRSLEHYVAGLPFPDIDPSDPDAAVKVMWNYEYRPFATDDFEARGLTLETGMPGQNGAGMSIERRLVFGSFQRLFYNGRLFVDPRPELSNPEHIRYREGLYPLRGPADVQGVGEVSIRYQDSMRQDDTWLYLPSARRVRRLSSAQRSDALFGQDADLDSLLGFSGQVTSVTWRLLGEGVVLGCMHAQSDPVKWGEGSGDFVFDDVWEPRRVYVVEGVNNMSTYAYGKRVLYIDQETWVVLFSDIYDRQGALWKVWLNMFSARPQAGDAAALGAGITNPAAVMIDTQLGRATRASVGGQLGEDSIGWSFNRGGVPEDWFTISAMIEAGH